MRVVIKVGTSTLAYENTGLLHIRRMKQLCEVLSDIKNAGHEVILVSPMILYFRNTIILWGKF